MIRERPRAPWSNHRGHQAYDASAINLKGDKAIVNFNRGNAACNYSLHKRAAGSSKYLGVSYYKKASRQRHCDFGSALFCCLVSCCSCADH